MIELVAMWMLIAAVYSTCLQAVRFARDVCSPEPSDDSTEIERLRSTEVDLSKWKLGRFRCMGGKSKALRTTENTVQRLKWFLLEHPNWISLM